MGISLLDMVEKMSNYKKILKEFLYSKNEMKGKKPWTIRHDNSDGSRIETRDSDWTYYDKNGKEIKVGKNPEDLKEFLTVIIKNKGN